MGFFNNILEKLGLKKSDSAPAAAKPAAAAPTAAAPAKPAAAAPAAKPEPSVAKGNYEPLSAPLAVPEVDVVKKLEKMAAGSNLDWKVSIVDMLKVLGIDSSKESRIELAKELGCPAELIGGDYSKMNVWLHKEVLKQIALNGGNIPKNLLD
jgi:3-oxoacyl-ACP reductase-like protein